MKNIKNPLTSELTPFLDGWVREELKSALRGVVSACQTFGSWHDHCLKEEGSDPIKKLIKNYRESFPGVADKRECIVDDIFESRMVDKDINVIVSKHVRAILLGVILVEDFLDDKNIEEALKSLSDVIYRCGYLLASLEIKTRSLVKSHASQKRNIIREEFTRRCGEFLVLQSNANTFPSIQKMLKSIPDEVLRDFVDELNKLNAERKAGFPVLVAENMDRTIRGWMQSFPEFRDVLAGIVSR